MCGIIGYNGPRKAETVLIDGLKKLEYRGYDSAGIALMEKQGIRIFKKEGKVAALESILPKASNATIGIGHTRWATHGAPEDRNAHPHSWGKVTLVHNGIIENDQSLRTMLKKQGLSPISDTDTELIAMLIDHCYRGDPRDAIRAACALLEGSYALGILFEDHPQILYAVRKDSPLLLGVGNGEFFIASDIPAFLEYTPTYCLLEEGEIAELSAREITLYDRTDRIIEKPHHIADFGDISTAKDGYEHFMKKEIFEQPSAVQKTIDRYYKNGCILSELGVDFRVEGKIILIGCGSAYHAALLGKNALEKYARIPTEVAIASEFRYSDPLLKKEDLVVLISQSGETADTLAALRLAKEKGVPTLGIVNVFGSSIAREADTALYTMAGPEISVATTKAYTCQAVLLYLLAMKLAHRSPAELNELPQAIERALEQKSLCKKLAAKYASAEHLFFIGRGRDYAVSREGSLKLKEISYIHSEAYAAGELKHGTISLIEENTPVIAIITDRTLLPKTAANIKEVRARGAQVLCIAPQTAPLPDCDRLDLPDCGDLAAPIAAAVLCQLFAYYAAIARGTDIDQPRNLAKSVTVE
ncbi:MAG: glutamine--fructose-6-phosphate transaminase (isomerizing) [Clostridia bacterium]|nr:glutamine--fructose-6-phosphate transaminase (isomerizing) [Clostridia bacterium]